MSLKVLEKEAKNITKQIVAKYHPEKVVLFGSVARGVKNPHDIDLLIIKKTKQSKLHRSSTVRKQIGFEYPLDILVRTPQEIGLALKEKHFFFEEVFAEGKVLYDQSK